MNFIKGILGLKKEDQPKDLFLQFLSEGRLYIYQGPEKKCM
jgi:hypothetical protein